MNRLDGSSIQTEQSKNYQSRPTINDTVDMLGYICVGMAFTQDVCMHSARRQCG